MVCRISEIEEKIDMREFLLNEDVTGTAYIELIRFLAKRSEYIMFVITIKDYINEHGNFVIKKLASLGGKTSQVDNWPGTTSLDGSTATACIIPMSGPLVELIATINTSLFSWKLPNFPEDPCFFRSDTSVLFSSTTHEDFATINMTEDDQQAWMENEFLKKVQIVAETTT